MSTKPYDCPECGAKLQVPSNVIISTYAVGCRLVELAVRMVCGTCGKLLEVTADAN